MNTEPELIPSGGGRFDVVVDGHLVYSKYKTGVFPDENRLVDELVLNYGGQ